ncbi:MAG: HAMP domain-containing histidine kinase [Deltaproteobacteria bacterium]|nr:HAMP domain-containing histidine kinase [Deltaproteobacteria bacterium]
MKRDSSLFTRAVLTAVYTPLLLAIIVLAVTLIRLNTESHRATEIKARVGSTWIADRLSTMERDKWDVFLSRARATLRDTRVGLFRQDGAQVNPGRLVGVPRSDITRIISDQKTEILMDGSSSAVASSALNGSPMHVVIAANRPKRSAFILEAASRLCGLAAILVFIAAVFGIVFGKSLSAYAGSIKNRIAVMIDADRLPRISREETNDEKDHCYLGRAVSDLEERFRGDLIMYRDALEEINHFDEQKTAFLSTISKDLHSPLTKIVDKADQLLRGEDGALQENQAEDMRIVLQAGNRLLHMASDLLDLSSLISKGIERGDELVDVKEVAQEVVETARGGIGDKEVEIVLNLDDAPYPLVRGSRQRLWQVLTNLVSNGIKFTEQGMVTVSVGSEGDSARIEVTDTGIGIQSDDQQAIFDPFKQRGKVSKRLRGTGLGLAICRHLVELHGGTIRVDSTQGEGSRFTVILPGDR